MEEKISKSYERYLQGMALQEKGDTAEEIAQAIGLKNAAAWYSTRAYHGGRKLAQRAIPKTENTPEPAAILEGINCERTAPRPRPMLNAECGMRNAETGPVSQAASNGLKAVEGLFGRLKGSKPADVELQGYEKALNAMLEDEKPRRVAVLRMVCAEGERVRYRLQDGQVNIHAKGQKRCALALSIEEARGMILELTDFLAQTEAMV